MLLLTPGQIRRMWEEVHTKRPLLAASSRRRGS
jgi:hypothetical protein